MLKGISCRHPVSAFLKCSIWCLFQVVQQLVEVGSTVPICMKDDFLPERLTVRGVVANWSFRHLLYRVGPGVFVSLLFWINCLKDDIQNVKGYKVEYFWFFESLFAAFLKLQFSQAPDSVIALFRCLRTLARLVAVVCYLPKLLSRVLDWCYLTSTK